MRIAYLLAAVALALPAARADRLSDLENRADEVAIVTLDASTLQGLLQAVRTDDPEEARMLRALAGVKAIRVRSLEFHGGGMPDPEDIRAEREAVVTAGWSQFLSSRSKDPEESVEGYAGPEGLAIVVAEPGELTTVHIEGLLAPGSLPLLGHHFGLPGLQVDPSAYASGALPPPGSAARPAKLDFKKIVHEIEEQDGIHRLHIPLFGLVKPVAYVASGGRARALDMAIFEDAPPAFIDSVARRVPAGWSRMVEVREHDERTNIFVGEVNKSMALLIATWDGDGVMLTVKASLQDLAKDPLAWAQHDQHDGDHRKREE